MEEYKKLTGADINKLEGQLKDYNDYMNERDYLEKDRNNLRKLL